MKVLVRQIVEVILVEKVIRRVAIAGLVAAGILMLTMSPWDATPPSEGEWFTVQTLDVGGQNTLLMRPKQWKNRRLVLYVHGASGSAQAIAEYPVRPLTEALLMNGFAVAASDAHGPRNWGNPASVADYVRLAERLKYRHIFLLAQSMGGLDGVRLIDKIRPEAWAGIYPVCNARVAYDNPLLRPYIEKAWHGLPPKYLSPVKAHDVRGLRVLIWASPADRLVSFKQNAKACATDMRRRGARVRLVRTVGDHGDPSNFRAQPLVHFFENA